LPHDDVASFLPLSPAVFHVMVSLAGGSRHGYAIIKDVAERTGGAEHLGAGTLYAIIKRLLYDDLIVELPPSDSDPAGDQRRRYYRLTPLGRKVATAEAERLERAVTSARSSRLLPAPGSTR
jgi:DNA-binding PadR family transcriptional regulator